MSFQKQKKSISGFIPAVIWMIVIFAFSAVPAAESTEQSVSVTGMLVHAICSLTGQTALMQAELIAFLEPIVRKAAHMTEYAVLLLMLIRPLSSLIRPVIKAAVPAFAFCVVYACSDEFHQTFVSGRAGRLTDVLIDSSGAFLALIIFLCSNCAAGQRKAHRSREE